MNLGAFLILHLLFTSALAAGQSLTIQGKVLDGSNNPVSGSATQFRVQILSPDGQRCVLFDETHVKDLSNTGGLFSINLNDSTGTANAPNNYTLEQALSNRAAFTVNSSYCASGSGTLTYTPGANDNRKVVIQFRDPGTMSSFETIPEMDLNPVAWSMESRTVGGFPAASVLRVVAGGVPASAPTLSTADVTDLQALLGGTSTKYMARDLAGGARLPSYSGDPASPAVGSFWLDTTGSGTLKFKDSAGNIQSLGSGGGGGGTITGVTAGSGLTGGGTSGTVTVGLPTTGVTGAGSAVGAANTVPVITYDAYGRLTSVTTATISGTLPAGTTGQFLKSSGGSTWAGAGILMGDLKNGAGTLPLFGTVNCTAGQSMYWDSGADQIRCQNIAVGNAQISDLAWGKLTGVPNLVANAGGTPALLTDTEANLPTVHVNGRIFFTSDTKKIFRDNGTGWDELAQGSGGTLTNVLSGAGISVSGTGATRTVTLDNTGKAAGTFYKVTTDADGRVSSGAGALLAVDIPNLDWSKITTGKPNLVLNGLDTTSFTSGPTSAKPAGQTAGRVFIDTTLQKIQYDNGTAWIDVASNGGTGFTGSLAGEVSGTQGATQVDSINGITRSTITTNLNAVTNATDAATASQLVKRDANGDFAGRYISASQINLKDGSSNVVSLKANNSSATYSLQLPAAAPAANQILQSDASGVLSWINPFSGSGISVSAPITNTSGTIGIPSANTSRDGYLTQADWNTFSGKLSSALNSALIWVGNGSNVATPVAPSGNVSVDNAGKFTVTGIRDQSISAAGSAAGQILRYASANTWTPQFLSMGDLRSTVTGTQALTTGCTASQTLTWNSGTDSLQCQSISVAAASQITGVLPIANGGTGTSTTSQGFVFAGPTSGAGAPAFRALAASDLPASASYWQAATGGINFAGGNVGIGTTAPSKPLSVVAASGMQALFQSTGTNHAGVFVDNAAGSLRSIIQLQDAGTTKWQIGKETDNTFFIADIANSKNVMATNGGNLLLEPASGSVGIGTASPSDILHVANSSTSRIRIDGGNSRAALSLWNGAAYFGSIGTTGAILSDSTSDIAIQADVSRGIRLYTGGTAAINERMRIDYTGNVGIGTNAPTVTLDLATRTDAIRLPAGTNVQQPGQSGQPAAANGMIRYNSSTNALEAYVNGAWTNLATVGGTQSFAGNVSVGGTFTSTGAASLNGGATIAGGALNMSSQNISGVGSNITGSGALTIASGGTNTNLALNSSGTGAVNVGSGNGTSLSVLDGGASTVNYVTVKGAASGASPVIGTAGGDTNIDLTFTPKGSGRTVFSSGNVGIGTTNPNGPLEIYSASPGNGIMRFNAPAGQYRFTRYMSAGSSRWDVGVNSAAESGSNAGADFFWNRFDDAGAYLDTPLSIARNTGNVAVKSMTSIGSVGIGIASPSSTLHVNGTGQFNPDASVVADTAVYAPLGVTRANSLTGTPSYFALTRQGNVVWGQGILASTNAWQLGTQAAADPQITKPWVTVLPTSGYVGIGTTTPKSPLQVQSDNVGVTLGTNSFLGSNIYWNSAWKFDKNGYGNAIKFDVSGDTQFLQAGNNTSGADAAATVTSAMIIKAGGNVGIGTSAPISPLEVYGTTNGQSTVSGPGTGVSDLYLRNYTNSKMWALSRRPTSENDSFGVLYYNGSAWAQPVTVLTGGNVGIGTAAPAAKLEVAGEVIRTLAHASGTGEDDTDNGQVVGRVLNFTKRKSGSSIRLGWADILRVMGPTEASCRWEIRVDGNSCPSPILIDAYNAPGSNVHSPASYFGYCDGLSAGAHQVQIWVYQKMSDNSGNPGNCFTGLRVSRWTLEAEEVN